MRTPRGQGPRSAPPQTHRRTASGGGDTARHRTPRVLMPGWHRGAGCALQTLRGHPGRPRQGGPVSCLRDTQMLSAKVRRRLHVLCAGSVRLEPGLGGGTENPHLRTEVSGPRGQRVPAREPRRRPGSHEVTTGVASTCRARSLGRGTRFQCFLPVAFVIFSNSRKVVMP